VTVHPTKPKKLSSSRRFAAAILLLAFALRLVGIGGIDLGLDGGLSVALARMPFSDAVSLLAHDVHPPLFYTVLRLWLGNVGTTPFAAKYLGALLSTLLVAATIGWTRSVVGARGALFAGLALAVAPAAVEVGAGVREFGPAVTLMTLAAWTYTGWSRRSRFLFVLLTAAALWTSYAAVAIPVGAAIDAIARRSWRRLAFSVVAGATILPWLAYIFSQGFLGTLESNGPRQNNTPPAALLSQAGGLAQVLIEGNFFTPSWIGPTIVGVAAILLLVGLVVSRTSSKVAGGWFSGHGVFIGAALLASLVVAFAVNTTWTREGMSSRYALPSLPFILLLLAALVQMVATRRPALGAVAVAIPVIGLVGTVNWYARPVLPADFWSPKATVGFLDEHVGEHDQIVFVSAEQAGYYEAMSQQRRPWTLVSVGTDYLAGNIAARSAKVLPAVAAQSQVVWLLLWHPTLGTGTATVGDWLSLHAFPLEPLTTTDSELDPYLTAAAASARPDPIGVDFADGVHLSVATWPLAIRPGDLLPVELDWTAPGPLDVNYTVFVHLVDNSGKVWAQQDGWPVNGRAPTTQWQVGLLVQDRHALTVPSNLLPGQYWIEVGLYDSRGRLGLRSGGDTVRVGPILDPA
jgi:hypothetical protein